MYYQRFPTTNEGASRVKSDKDNRQRVLTQTEDSDSRRPFVHLRRPLNLGLTFLTLQSPFPTCSLPLSKKKQKKTTTFASRPRAKQHFFSPEKTRKSINIRVHGKRSEKGRGKKRSEQRSKTDTFPHQTDTFSSQMDKISEETDTFDEHHANRKRGAGLELFLLISRLLASASLIGSRSDGGKSSCVVAS